jgi:solute carrier family 25 protein 39/40
MASAAANASLLEKWNFAGCGPACVRAANPALPAEACGAACAPPPVYRGAWHALRSIAATEGVPALWRGTNVALMMAIPMVGIYLPLYDYLLEEARREGAGAMAPLAAGTLARTAAVYCTAPFELLRTRLQAAHMVRVSPEGYGIAAAGAGGATPAPARLLSHLPSLTADIGAAARARALRSLWTGVGATLARDVPFSGLYWAMVEPIRKTLVPPGGARTEMEVCIANVAAGGIAGGLSGVVTTPLDVVKTRAQLAMGRAHPVAGTLRAILRDEGVAGLCRGWGARSAKAAPACAIVLSAYEMMKFWPTVRA